MVDLNTINCLQEKNLYQMLMHSKTNQMMGAHGRENPKLQILNL